jgi:hypothetical protein
MAGGFLGGEGGFGAGPGSFLGGMIRRGMKEAAGPSGVGPGGKPAPEDPGSSPSTGTPYVDPGGLPISTTTSQPSPLAFLFGSPILLALVGFAVYWFFFRKKR